MPVYDLISLMTIGLGCYELDHHVKNGKRGACKPKTAMVRRTTT